MSSVFLRSFYDPTERAFILFPGNGKLKFISSSSRTKSLFCWCYVTLVTRVLIVCALFSLLNTVLTQAEVVGEM